MFELIPANTNIPFVKYRHFFAVLSVISVLGAIVLFFVKGLNYGIDFRGGAEVQIRFKDSLETSVLRDLLTHSQKFKNVSLQQIQESSLGGASHSSQSHEFLARLGQEEENLQNVSQVVESVLLTQFSKDQFEIVRTDVVGPQAGEQLKKSGFLSLLYALLCIFIYVALRFDSRYSPGAVMALLHDSMITIGIFVLLQREFSLQILAAILTIIGYSNNDTIIVFDRIRETMKAHPHRSLEENINRSINETLSRTILTSLCTFLVTFSLVLFGGGVIRDFAFTMCVGIVVGTYSSIFIASPILIYMTKLMNPSASGVATRSR